MWSNIATSENLTGLMAVILLFSMPIVIVVAALIYKAHKITTMRETIEYMVDKGQPVPPSWLQEKARPATPGSPLRRGIMLIAVGAGVLVLCLSGPEGLNQLWGMAAIPLFLGFGQLLIWKIERRS